MARTFGLGLLDEHAQVELADPLWRLIEGIEVEPMTACGANCEISEPPEGVPVLVLIEDERDLCPTRHVRILVRSWGEHNALGMILESPHLLAPPSC